MTQVLSKVSMLLSAGVGMIGATLLTYGLIAVAAQDDSFEAFLPTFEQGINRFINGDSVLWKQNASKTAHATIMGAWGAYEHGWEQADARYDWAVARFKQSGAKASFEYISSEVSGDLAYTVAIERSQVELVDQDNPSPMALRVTHVYRRENGQWKMVHRHADPLMTKTAPAAVLPK